MVANGKNIISKAVSIFRQLQPFPFWHAYILLIHFLINIFGKTFQENIWREPENFDEKKIER